MSYSNLPLRIKAYCLFKRHRIKVRLTGLNHDILIPTRIKSKNFENRRPSLSSTNIFSVRRPISIPSSVKLISIIKSDPLNRFVLLGDGNIAKVRFNMQTDPDQESLWVAKWRDDIASYITKQQWSSPSIGML